MDKESSSTTCSKVQKTLKNKNSLMWRHELTNRNDTTCDGFAKKWNEAETDELGNEQIAAFENYGMQMCCIKGIKSFVKGDFDSYEIKHNNDDLCLREIPFLEQMR